MDQLSGSSDDGVEDEYWAASAQTGFNFDTDDWKSVGSTGLPSLSKQGDVNKFDLSPLPSERPSDVAENKTLTYDIFATDFSSDEEELQAEKYGSCSDLDLSLKQYTDEKMSAIHTVQNLIIGKDYSFNKFKAKVEKQELLKAAVNSHDGNAILAVVMFLKNTLKRSLFHREIGIFPDAVNTYLLHLYEDHEIDELTNMLLLLDMPNETAMLKYDTILPMKTSDRKYQLIENCLNTYFQSGVVRERLREGILEHKMCLEDQIVLQDHKISIGEYDLRAQLFAKLTGERHLFDSSAMSSLIFSVINFYEVPKIAAISPVSIGQKYKFSQKQYTWSVVRALAGGKKWPELEQFFVSKNWLRGSRMRSSIGFVRVIELLSKLKAPSEVLSKYINCIDNTGLKLRIARKCKCHAIVIEILKKNKDRLGLIQYMQNLDQQSYEFCSIVAILKNEPVNWKN